MATFCLRHFTDVANERTKPDQVYQEKNRTNLTQSLAVCARQHETDLIAPTSIKQLIYGTDRLHRDETEKTIWNGTERERGKTWEDSRIE